MNQLIIVVPALKGSLELIVKKLNALISGSAPQCQIVIHADSPALQRHYFFTQSALSDAESEFRKAVEKWSQDLVSCLQQEGIATCTATVWDREIDHEVGHLAQSMPDSWLVLVNMHDSVSDHYKKIIHNSSNPILLLGKTNWRDDLEVLAAIDPLHGHDRPQNTDLRVIELSKSLCKTLGGKLQMLHSCYVPPYLLKYQQQIQSIHKESIKSFVEAHGLQKREVVTLSGDPASTLRQYIKTQNIEVLALGSVARGFIQRKMIGSTTEQLLAKPPCDLLLCSVRHT